MARHYKTVSMKKKMKLTNFFEKRGKYILYSPFVIGTLNFLLLAYIICFSSSIDLNTMLISLLICMIGTIISYKSLIDVVFMFGRDN